MDHLPSVNEGERFQASISIGSYDNLFPVDRADIGSLTPKRRICLLVVPDASIGLQHK
jgi:hypothetical protein